MLITWYLTLQHKEEIVFQIQITNKWLTNPGFVTYHLSLRLFWQSLHRNLSEILEIIEW